MTNKHFEVVGITEEEHPLAICVTPDFAIGLANDLSGSDNIAFKALANALFSAVAQIEAKSKPVKTIETGVKLSKVCLKG